VLVTVSRGIQNYTCSNGIFESVGALADLFDASCILTQAGNGNGTEAALLSQTLPILAFNALSFPDALLHPDAHHEFIDTPGSSVAGAISPKFFLNNGTDVVGVKNGSINAPDAARDVTWLQLTAQAGQGDLAKTVYRINTVGGQPTASCNISGETISVPYAAMYWFLA